MNNLTPEKRVDKNGRVVTKHVRLNGQSPAKKPSIPSPQLSGVHLKRVDEFRKKAIHFTSHTLGEKNRIEKSIMALSEDDMDFAESVVNGAATDNGKRQRQIMVRQVLQSGTRVSSKLRSAEFLIRESKINPVLALSFMNTLRKGGLGTSVYSVYKADPETQHKVCELSRSFFRMTKTTDRYENKGKITIDLMNYLAVSNGEFLEFTQPELADTMMKHPERSMEVLDWYLKRGTLDGVDSLLESSPALGDGAL